MSAITCRKRYLLVPLAIVILCTFGLMSAAFAAAPGSHGNGQGASAQHATQGQGDPANGRGGVHGLQNAMERIQRNVTRQVAHLEKVMGHVPDQAKISIEPTVQRMQDHLQTLLAKLDETGQANTQPDQGTSQGTLQATAQATA